MTWIPLRSRRDPAVWLPTAAAALLVLAVGWAAHAWTSAQLEALAQTARIDRDAAVAGTVELIRLCEIALCVVSLAFGAFLARLFQLARREGRLPPSGWWSLGAWRALTGPPLRRACRLGYATAAFLPVSALAAVLAFELLLRELLNGSAGT